MDKVQLYIRELFSGRLWHRAIRRFGKDRGSIFTSIYKSRYWTQNDAGESVSGEGSSIAYTAKAREAIESVVREFGIRSMLDAPCGDFNWMRLIHLEGVDYTGADIVKPLIDRNNKEFGSSQRRFIHLDIVEQVCEPVDLILCRDCVQHLTNAEAMSIIRNFSKSGSKYLLMTMSPRMTSNSDMPKAGGFRALNLFLPPFNLPKPEREYAEVVHENPSLDKTLGLWKLPLSAGG